MWKSQFSINKVGHILIPYRHRKTRFIAWVKVMLAYLAMIKEDLYLWWDETVIDASMTPQIMYLERLLNLRTGQTEIYIGEGFSHGPWVYTIAQAGDPEFYMDQPDESWVYTMDESSEIDFVIHTPTLGASQYAVIAAIAHRYKLPGKQFIIQKDL